MLLKESEVAEGSWITAQFPFSNTFGKSFFCFFNSTEKFKGITLKERKNIFRKVFFCFFVSMLEKGHSEEVHKVSEGILFLLSLQFR